MITNRARTVLSFLISAFLCSAVVMGCKAQPAKSDQPPQKPQPPAFAWDTMRRLPRWRVQSPIMWHRTHDVAAVIEEARSAGKPVFLYLSRYERYFTSAIEGQLLAADGWGAAIADRFVTWELDAWEKPALADKFVLGTQYGLPGVLLLKPDTEASSDRLLLADSWSGNDIFFFPGHELYVQAPATLTELRFGPDSVDARMYFDRMIETEGRDLPEPVLPADPGDPAQLAENWTRMVWGQLSAGKPVSPERGLLLAYDILARQESRPEVGQLVAEWGERLRAISPDLVWFPGSLFRPADSRVPANDDLEIDPIRTLRAAACAEATGADWPIDPEKLFLELHGMITLEAGRLGGGFPAYLDASGVFQGDVDYLGGVSIDELEDTSRLLEPVMGPRDLAWVNARMMASWLKLLAWNPSLADMDLPGGRTVGGFLQTASPVLLEGIEERTDLEHLNPVLLADRIYLLDLLNQMYQMWGDVAFLEKAGGIAGTLPADEFEEWFSPSSVRLFGDLAVFLHEYGWLAENEDARSSAREITEASQPYMYLQTGTAETMELAYAYEITHSKCIHVAVLASPDDAKGRDLLEAALEGWDPRKVAQILDPERDADLIERKGYVAMDEAVAYVCIDDICYPPVRSPGELRETLEEVKADLAAELDEKK